MVDSNFIQILSTTRLNHYLNLRELKTLVKYSKVMNFLPGEILLKQGEIASGLYIILEGTVAVVAKILGEGTAQLTSLQHGNLVGEISMIDKNPSSVSSIAHTEISCLFITNEYLAILAALYPKTYYRLKQVITDEARENLHGFHKKTTKMMETTDMMTRSLFSSVIKSMNKPTPLDASEVEHYLPQLANIDLFNYLTDSEKKILLKNCELIKASDECVLIQEDHIDLNIYIILYGAVQSSIIHENKVAKLSVLGPLDMFCSLSVFDKTSASIINYATCERSILLKISHQNIQYLQKKLPIWYKLFNLICESFVTLERSVEKLDVRLNIELYNR